MLTSGVCVEKDDDEFELKPRDKADLTFSFDKNNIEVNAEGKFLGDELIVKDGKRMPTLAEVM